MAPLARATAEVLEDYAVLEFSDCARLAMEMAHQEVARDGYEYFGTEHLLVGLIKTEKGTAIKALLKLSCDVTDVIARAERLLGTVRSAPQEPRRVPQTPRLKWAIKRSMAEAEAMGHDYVGTGHLLLGLMRDEDSVPSVLLASVGISYAAVREAVVELLSAGKEGCA